MCDADVGENVKNCAEGGPSHVLKSVSSHVKEGQRKASTSPVRPDASRSENCVDGKSHANFDIGRSGTHVEKPNASIDSVPDKDQHSVGILFLAHDGVTNPLLWEKWRASDKVFASRIRFFVFRNTKISHPSFFTTKYDLKLRLRTKWCSSSIVHATIKSLQAVLEGDTSVGMIYIVSGYDIPIQPPSALFTTRSVITEGVFKNVVPFRSVIAFTPGEDMDLKEASGWGKRNEKLRQSAVSHVQWCGLTRGHARLIVAYPDLKQLFKLGNKISSVCCPDEWVLGTALLLQLRCQATPTKANKCGTNGHDDGKEYRRGAEGVRHSPREADVPTTTASDTSIPNPSGCLESFDVIDWPITDQYRSGRQAQSPLLWEDMEATSHKVLWAPPRTYRSFTLATVIERVSRQEGNLFFRKVGPLKEAEIGALFRLITDVERATAPLAPCSARVSGYATKIKEQRSTDIAVAPNSEIHSCVTDSEDGNDDTSASGIPATPLARPRRISSRLVASLGHRVREMFNRKKGCWEGLSGTSCCEDCRSR